MWNFIIFVYKKLYFKLFGVVHLSPVTLNSQRILLSYLAEPFLLKPGTKLSTFHSNYWECAEIANTFLEKGYRVDVINWDNERFAPRYHYDICVDVHNNLRNLTPYLKNTLKIFHITNAHWSVAKENEELRLSALKQRRGVILVSRRTLTPSYNIEEADCATMLGNDYTESTYAFAKKEIFRVPVSSPFTFEFPKQKNFDAARKHFLWLGGSGAVHKGLDITLEAFAHTPELQLTVCGPIKSEEDFLHAYNKELNQTSNISYLGRIDLAGPKFLELVYSCGAVILPSSSEGGGGSVINCMQAGLVPVVTKETSVDTVDFGIIIPEATVEGVVNAIQNVAKMSADELRTRSERAWHYARLHHTQELFAKNYRDTIETILKKYGK
jgi:glycosyltransferase involved in cell wall biosynthesis